MRISTHFSCYKISVLLLISGYGDIYDDEDDEYDLEDVEGAPAETKKDDDNNIYKDMTRTRFVHKSPCIRAANVIINLKLTPR